MARTIIYENSTATPQGQNQGNGNIRIAANAGNGQPQDKPVDKFPDKLAKYIPAEALAFFVPYSVADQDTSVLITALVIGCIATPVYLYVMAFKNNPTQMPRFYFYILASLAFFAWAQATSEVGSEVFKFSKTWSAFILTAAVLLIPAIDELLTVIEKKTAS